MLTPEEIQSREFLVSLRGYDRDEVQAFLGRVAEQLAQTEARASQLQQRLDRLKAQQPAAATAEAAPTAASASSPEPSAMFAEIGKETQRILEAAQEAGQQIQRKARQEADRDLQGARGQAAKLIAEGERRREHIERIVSELEQSRAAMSVQLRGVGRAIEQTLRELAPEDQGGSPGGSSTVREAIGSAAATPAPASAPAATPASTSPSRAASAAAPAPAQPAQAPTADDTDDEPGESGGADGADDDAATAAPEPEPSAAEDASPGADASDDTATTSPAAEPALSDEEPAAPAPASADENEPVAGGAVAATPDTDAGDDPPAAPAPAASDDNASASVRAAAAPVTATEPAMPPPPAAAGDAQPDAQALRAAALSPLHPKLVRKVKRELQEIQNITLDSVRRAKGKGDVEDFLPDESDTAGLGEGSGDLLRQAWDSGVASAGSLARTDLQGGGDAPDLAAAFLADAAERVRSGLASTLRMGLSAEEGQQALSDRIGAVFAEFKGAQAEELAATHLIRAYEYGLLGAWTEGGIQARRWVMGREPRCPEAKCRSNDQGGAVAVGESFPSGHQVPPVHVGCTCTTVPEASSA